MNVTFTRGFEGGGLACGGETLSADPSGVRILVSCCAFPFRVGKYR